MSLLDRCFYLETDTEVIYFVKKDYVIEGNVTLKPTNENKAITFTYSHSKKEPFSSDSYIRPKLNHFLLVKARNLFLFNRLDNPMEKEDINED